jgi:hypothetical protein
MSKTDKIIAIAAPVSIAAAAGEGETKGPRSFEVLAYTGGALEVDAFDLPIVVDLKGLKTTNSLVANLDHVPSQRVGHVTDKKIDGSNLVLSGLMSAATQWREEVVASADSGFGWQASIEARPTKVVPVAAGKTVEVNGQQFTGPLYVARQSTLRGFAFVSHGADDNTRVTIAATAASLKEKSMEPKFVEWIEAMGFDAESLTDSQRDGLLANFKGLHKAAEKPKGKTQEEASLDTILAAQKAERERIKAIGLLTEKYLDENPQSPFEVIEAMSREAIEDKLDPEKFELKLLRATRPQGHTVMRGKREEKLNDKVLEAAICLTGRLAGVESKFDEQTLDAADRNFRNGLGVQELLLIAAQRNGYTGRSVSDVRSVLQYAFTDIKATGFSTISIPGILSNTANKFLLEGFMGVDQSWREVSSTRSVRNFQAHTTYSLTGAFEYEKVGAGGELKHGTIGEETYTNQADTYGKTLAITRKDIVNDDLGALTAVPRRLGRGAGLALNTIFWTEFMADASTFYTTGRGNYFEGGTTNLQSSSLKTAVEYFLKQTDPDGKPLGVMPTILLVPPEVKSLADELYVSTNINTGGAASTEKVPNANVFANKYRPVCSPYLSNTSFTGYSTTAWYLLASPADMSVIEVAFLNGRDTPIVETAEADFSTLGIQMRGYHDFGVNKQEYRAAVKSKGAS